MPNAARRAPLALLLSAALAACAGAPDPGPASAARETTVTRTAVVESVDRETRQFLIQMDDGRKLSLVAGPEIRNFDQIEPGDVIRAEFLEAVAVRMADASSSPGPTAAVVAERAALGERPGAGAAASVNLVVEFVAYDPATNVASFFTPDGVLRSVVVRPEMRAFAAARKPGDLVDLTITEAAAISVEEIGG